MSRAYDCFASNRTKMPIKDLQAILNGQFHVIFDLFTGIHLFLTTLSYGKNMLWYSFHRNTPFEIWIMISYSKDTSANMYLASGFGGDLGDVMT